MKKLPVLIAAMGAMTCVAVGQTVSKTMNTTEIVNGYVSIFELPSNGGGYQWGSGWGIGDLTVATTGTTTAQMGATQVGDGASYWIVGGTGGPGNYPAPGSAYTGNKISEATYYAQVGDGSLAGSTLQFAVNITNFSLQSPYVVKLVIKESANGYTPVATTITGTGLTTVSSVISAAPGNIVQWGLMMTGPNVVPGDQFRYGSVTATAVPEPATYGLLVGLATLGLVAYRRRRGARA